MNIDDYLAGLLPAKPRQSGSASQAYAFDWEVTDAPVLETERGNLDASLTHFDLIPWPEDVALYFTLEAQSLCDALSAYTLQFISKGVPDRPLRLGHVDEPTIQRCCASLQLKWLGAGIVSGEGIMQDDHEVLLRHMLDGYTHTKSFSVPPGSNFVCEEQQDLASSQWLYGCSLWPGLRPNERPLIPFGGYIPLDLDLEKVMPMFAALKGGEGARIELKAQTYWQRYGIAPGQRGYVQDCFYSFVGTAADSVQNSLAQDIKDGGVRFGADDVRYQSYDYEIINALSKTILIHFKRG